jgi:tripartite-type tricarboxylate transporter receptor subunit TctC
LSPGGPVDTVARVLAEQIGKGQGPTVVVENRPGAGTIVGTEFVAHASPDGQTLLMTASTFVVNPHFRKLDYDPLTGFEPICCLVNSPPVIVVGATSPYRTIADLLNAARAKPGEVSLASVGPATGMHVLFEMLRRAANVDMTFIPFPGDAATIAPLLGGHVTSALVNYSSAAEQLKAGTLRALVVATPARIDLLPDVPTVVESGYGDFVLDQEFGVVAPVRTSKEIVARLIGLFATALQAPEVKAKLTGLGLFPVGMCGAEFAARLCRRYITITATSFAMPTSSWSEGGIDETSPPQIPASGRRRYRASASRRSGARLSDAAGTHHRRLPARLCGGHSRAPAWPAAVGAARPTVCCR